MIECIYARTVRERDCVIVFVIIVNLFIFHLFFSFVISRARTVAVKVPLKASPGPNDELYDF